MHHAQLGSTNDEALSLAAAGDPGCVWVVADEQTKGRGRRGRQWSSPLGNLYASLLLIDPAPPYKAAELGFVSGVALWHAIRDILGDPLIGGGHPFLKIKWPNDILFNGAKLAGILLESTQLLKGGFACVIGMGVNCVSHPETALYAATDLTDIGGAGDRRDDVFLRLSYHFVQWLEVWDQGRNFEAIRSEWLAHAHGIGTQISVAAPGGARGGLFDTIDGNGRLILNADGKMLTIDAGDVFFGPEDALRGSQAHDAAPISLKDRS